MYLKFKIYIVLILGLTSVIKLHAQEFNVTIVVNASRLNSSIDRNTFTSLQTNLTDFIGGRKWAQETFASYEKLKITFFLNLEATKGPDVYSGNLSIVASRPVFNSTYYAPLINNSDQDIVIKYKNGAAIEFNEFNIKSGDPLTSNLPAIFAFWCNIILGTYYESFQANNGQSFYQKAQQIVNNAPIDPDIVGWASNNTNKSRYWILENILNPRYKVYHQFIYTYYRKGLDNLQSNSTEARKHILTSLDNLYLLNTEFSGIFIIPFIMQGKTEELGGIFKTATKDEKLKFIQLMERVDVVNINRYQTLIDQ